MTLRDQAIFDCFEDLRHDRGLPKGMRWLTIDDTWQVGDEYNAHHDEWWQIGGPKTGWKPGSRVSPMTLCYTPRGKR